MRIRWRTKRERTKWQEVEHDWFAWHPVRVSKGELAWFETVRRVRVNPTGPFAYKAK